jgi:hypothetical protein
MSTPNSAESRADANNIARIGQMLLETVRLVRNPQVLAPNIVGVYDWVERNLQLAGLDIHNIVGSAGSANQRHVRQRTEGSAAIRPFSPRNL